jgi:hypothetical protein
MPEISRFFGIRISMVYNDHQPPHFHAEYEGLRAGFLIATGELFQGQMSPRACRLVQEWAGLHRLELEQNWQRRIQREPLAPIPPLE